MAVIKFHNTLTGQKEEFKPIAPGKVGMYTCGPTVYGTAHIGNLRAYVFADTLRRVLELNGYEVNQIMNITDIGHLVADADEGEDKMTAALKAAGKELNLTSLKEHADLYTEAFKEDLKLMNIEIALRNPANFPKASDHIEEDIELIKTLETKGFAYTISTGVYFDISKDPEYGKLGHVVLDKEEVQSRMSNASEKRNPQDFCLWKFDKTIGWESPWGKGFPGWHIECSAMSMKYLGETFDIHTGGMDHIPVHHNNEIAQSESATGKPFAHYWMHGAFITIEGTKIAKSLKNDIYLKDLTDRRISPLDYRYLLLTGHYTSPMNFTWEALEGSHVALTKIVHNLKEFSKSESTGNEKIDSAYFSRFADYVNDDLDTPKALALMWELIHDEKVSSHQKLVTILAFDKVFGLELAEQVATALIEVELPEEVTTLVTEREGARKNKDFKKSDELRDQIAALGFEIKDTESGPELSAK